jgi:hypothetical protein
MVLAGFQFGPARGIVVKDLDLHAGQVRPSLQGGPDAHAMIPARRQFELEAKDEIRVLVDRVEVALGPALFVDEHSVFHDVVIETSQPALPSFERLAIEQANETPLDLLLC